MKAAPGGIRALVQESAIYGLASLAGVLASFALAPVYLHELDPSQYGVASLVTTVGTFLSMAAILSLDTAAHRMVWQDESEAHRHDVFATWLRASLLASAIVLLVLGLVWLGAWAGGHRSDLLDLSVVWAASLPFRITHHVRLHWARARRRPLSAGAWALALGIATLVGGVVFVVVLDLGAAGVVASQTVAAAAVGGAAMLSPLGRRLLVMGWNRPLLRRMLKFSLPLLPAGLAGWFLAVGDRWILEVLYGSSSVGLYQAAFTVAGALSLPLAAFNQAFPPWAFSIHKDEAAPMRIRRAFDLVVVGASLAALLLSVLAPRLIGIIAQDDFADASTMVPYLAFSVVAQAVYALTAIGCNVAERNGPVAWAIVAGAVAIPPVVLLSDPWLGPDSVALSTLVSQAVAAGLVLWSAERLWPVGYRMRPVVFAVAGAALAVAVAG